MSELEKSSMHLIHIYINFLQLFTNFASYRLFTLPMVYTAMMSYPTSDFVEVVLGWFDRKIFWCQKHELNASKYFSKHFFMNRDAKLYVIMLFIL